MRHLLHLLTRPADDLVGRLLSDQRALPDVRVEVVDLTAADPDYRELVERIFAADSVATW